MSDLARTRAELLSDILFPRDPTTGLDGAPITTSKEAVDDAIERAQALVDAQGDDPWPHFILGLAQGMRYLDRDVHADGERAVERLREAVRLSGRTDPDAALIRQQLAATLAAVWANAFSRNPGGTDPAELAEGLRLAREAVELTPEGSPQYPVRLMQVAELLGQGADGPGRIGEAVEVAERALAAAHPDDPRLSQYQNSHALLLAHLAAEQGAADTAVTAEKSAIRAGHLAHPYDPAQMKIIGTMQRARMLSAPGGPSS
ncbi:hypothetical protein [Nocardiopsis suaedae]|uniref:Tetratricopeptide repeat protein n=1 Tax=Nocardiopsis suaedae TaxID=3018444 RepID=A0ABT4TFX4_9ACTN|nr:hypothetical protein [Nocardiopsis suaedae]MDA2803598.1 hypothetical protein [Nocardiopsis suaedae]